MKDLYARTVRSGLVALTLLTTALAVPAAAQQPGEPAPALEVTTLEGETLTLADLEGQVVVLDFWATWCQPCLREIPDYNHIYEEYRDQGDGFSIVGLTIASGSEQDVRDWMEEGQELAYPVAVVDDSVPQAWGGVMVVPTTFVIGRDGKILKRFEGATQEKLDYIRELAGARTSGGR
ncbi:MAG: TlpA disulfide reductase family protein [bacterium]